jgi:hypothetical protein
MEALGFEMERVRTLVRFAHEEPTLAPVRLTEVQASFGLPSLRFAQDTAQPGRFEGVGDCLALYRGLMSSHDGQRA